MSIENEFNTTSRIMFALFYKISASNQVKVGYEIGKMVAEMERLNRLMENSLEEIEK